jgi:hypothetical protein
MAKIENTTAYPTVTPSMDDLLIATDVSDNNETVTFLVGDLIGGAGVLQGLQSVLDTGNVATQTMDLTGDINLLGGPGIGFLETCQIKLGGSYGAAGEVLTSQGAGSCAIWAPAASTSCCSWNDSLTIGNIATTKAIVDSNTLEIINAGGTLNILSPATLVNTGTSSFSGQVNINSTTLNFNASALLNDGTGSVGTPGQFLTSTGTGVAWSSTLPPASCCGIQSTIAAGNTSTSQNVTLTGTGLWDFGANVSITSAGNNTWSGNNTFSATGVAAATSAIALTGTLWDGASVGTAGQVLTSTGTGVLWAAASGGTQDLQSVLDTGNSATGANADITISGTIEPGTITDGTSSVGTPGQFLSSTGTGLTWVSGTCCDLQDTLTAGHTATTNIILSGIGTNLTAPLIIPELIQDGLGATGAAGQVLGLNAGATAIEWVAGGGGVSSVTASVPTLSTGSPITISPTTGAVLVELHRFGGSSNEGFVPDSSSSNQSTTFLRADGTWQIPAGGGVGVSDFTNANGTFISAGTVNTAASGSVTMGTIDLSASGVPSASTFLRGDNTWAAPSVTAGVTTVTTTDGTFINLTPNVPSSGAVTVTADLSATGVPSAGTYLRGDNTWAAISSATDSVTHFTKFYWLKITPGNNYVGWPSPIELNSGLTTDQDCLIYQNANSPAGTPGTNWDLPHLRAAMFYRHPESGECDTSTQRICSISVTLESTVDDTYDVEVWKFDPCNDAVAVEAVGKCAMDVSGADPDTGISGVVCCDITLPEDVSELPPGYGLLFTVRATSGAFSSVITGTLAIKLYDILT